MKKTSVTPSATFEPIPSPNQTKNIGARMTRGIALTALRYGSRTAEAVGDMVVACRVVPVALSSCSVLLSPLTAAAIRAADSTATLSDVQLATSRWLMINHFDFM